MRFENNSRESFGPRLIAAVPIFLSMLLLSAFAGAQTSRDPGAPDDLAQPPEDAVETATGLVTKVVQAGTGAARPDANDMVSVHYVGWTPFGAKFQSSYDRGQPGVFNLSTVFPVWREGIQLMVVGEKRRLWVPEHLAPPKPQDVPSGAVVFDIELMGIRPVPNPPKSLRKPPEDAEATGSGAHSRRIEEGTGENTPADNDIALMHWTGWTTNGKTFDSTIYRGRPTAFPLDRVLAPFADVVREMVEGEKRQIWIPGHLAAGQWPGAPRGQLIFEVELVRIMPAEVLQSGVPADSGSGSR